MEMLLLYVCSVGLDDTEGKFLLQRFL